MAISIHRHPPRGKPPPQKERPAPHGGWIGDRGDPRQDAPLTTAPGSSPYTITLADLDEDGDLDILNVSRFAGLVGWFRNDWRPPPPNDDPVTIWAWNLGVPEPDVLDLNSDSDGDGATLLEEFAYNLDPLVADTSPVPSGDSAGIPDIRFTYGTSYRSRGRFVRRRDRVALGLTYIIETSPDLENWTELAPGSSSNINPDYQRTIWNRILPGGGKPLRHFTRLRLEYNPPANP